MPADFTAYTPAANEGDYLRESVGITPEALSEEFIRVPGDLAYWGERFAEATQEALAAYAARKRVYAETLLKVKGFAKAMGEKLTEADAAASVEVDKAYQAAVLLEIQTEAQRLAAKLRFDAVVAKKDMIVSLGATQRAEMGPFQVNK